MRSAIVIGASVAGLAVAGVLSRRFASVTVLDRDVLPDDNTPRRGVPQSQQGHFLLVSGLQELEALFPDLERELVAAGGTRIDPGLGLRSYRFGRLFPIVATGRELISMSRPQLELLVRERVAELAGVTIRDRIAVTGLRGDGERVTGVTLDTGEKLDADLVVDCSGRSSRSDRWLGQLGFPSPERVEVKVGVVYSTRTYRRRPGDLPGWQAVLILPTAPAERMAGIALPLEGDRWLVTAGGWHVEDPPTDAAAFEAVAAALPDLTVAELIARTEPLTDPAVHRFPSSQRRLFERLDRLPAGYVAVGDAVCSFNPIYGQGMTCATREAVALGIALDQHGTASSAMARDYYRAAAEIIATPWRFAVGGDFTYPQTTGPRPRGIRLVNWYVRKIALAAHVRPDINALLLAVQQLVTPPGVLFWLAFVARVLWLARSSRVRG
jgi:2-polyprenyl-6-methoxyphenol hydroxylase-like FAD-dependent oxidoreductase